MSETAKMGGSDAERPGLIGPSPRRGDGRASGWEGPTYYGRPQLKSAPFNDWIVGGYIFLAGLSGSASLMGHLAELAGGPRTQALGRRARRLALLAPTIGSALLIQDLHTPKRFYNMLRVAKGRSPMSIGTWILMAFSAGAFPAAMLHALADRARSGGRWPRLLRRAARTAQAPASVAGAGLSVYTAALLSATSTPAWAAVPRPLAARFAASSVASGAAALMLGERSGRVRGTLAALTGAALAAEAAASAAQDAQMRAAGVEAANHGRWGRIEKVFALGLGVAAPLAMLGLSAVTRGGTRRALQDGAAVAALAGSAMLRISTLGLGDESASRPEISLRWAGGEIL